MRTTTLETVSALDLWISKHSLEQTLFPRQILTRKSTTPNRKGNNTGWHLMNMSRALHCAKPSTHVILAHPHKRPFAVDTPFLSACTRKHWLRGLKQPDKVCGC